MSIEPGRAAYSIGGCLIQVLGPQTTPHEVEYENDGARLYTATIEVETEEERYGRSKKQGFKEDGTVLYRSSFYFLSKKRRWIQVYPGLLLWKDPVFTRFIQVTVLRLLLNGRRPVSI